MTTNNLSENENTHAFLNHDCSVTETFENKKKIRNVTGYKILTVDTQTYKLQKLLYSSSAGKSSKGEMKYIYNINPTVYQYV